MTELLTDYDGIHIDRTHQGEYYIYTHNPLFINVGDMVEAIYSPRAWVLSGSIHRHWCFVRFEVVRSWQRNLKSGKMEEFKAYVVREERLLSDDDIAWCLDLIGRVEARA